MKKIGVIGTRKRNSGEAWKKVKVVLSEVYQEGDWLISGGCEQGADRFAVKFAKSEGAALLTIYPNYKRYNRGAPIVRNGPVADQCDIIVACVISPEDGIENVLARKTGGTEDTLRKFAARVKDYKDKIVLV